jgi:hypothetical protein
MIDDLLRPLFRYAWPKPAVDRLLRAALLDDPCAAGAAWREYEAAADFDRLTAVEMRLLGLVSRRLEALAPDSPMRPRIRGIERANWSRRQLAIGEARSGLQALEAERVNMLAIKGAVRVAADGTWEGGHLVDRIGIVVQLEDMERAFDLLTQDEWRPAGPGTAIYQRARLPDVASLTFIRGRFGNIRVHRTAFHPPYMSMADDAEIWRRSIFGKLGRAAVRLPSTTDAVAMALADGVRDAPSGGDCLAAAAVGIDTGVDWELFQFIADSRRLHAPAAAGLRYVRERLQRSVPDSVLRNLERAARRNPLALIAAFSKRRSGGGAIRMVRLAFAAAARDRLINSRPRIVFPSPFRCRAQAIPGVSALEQPLRLSGRREGEAWNGTFDLAISVELPPVLRRLDFEVNSNVRHHVRLMALVRNKGKRERPLRFRFPISLSPEDTRLVLTAAASRSFDANAPRETMDRYGAVPFKLVHLRATDVARR